MASQSVLELAVKTGKWDAGLRKAQSALQNFTQSNGGLQQALDKEGKSMQAFVQMMGKMDSTAKTAKGQMNDYKSTIEQLTLQYNRMTDAQQKSIGQDYLHAIEQIKQKYQSVNEEIQEMNRSLKNIEMPEMKGGGLFSGMGDKMSGALQVFGGNLMTKAAGMALSFAGEMKDMVAQGIELARQGEGIRIAFERLGRGDILDGLREATHGTVTDLELMKAAVKFNDFKLPLDELGTMLAFAQQKAKDTGQSVDYMVDSIVTGLGRKSLMILDNLGLSANEVKEKMAETGDMTKAVGDIIRDQMKNAGDYMETAADRAAQANVSLQNKMEELGRKFAPVEEASNQLWTSMKIAILDVVGGPLARLLNDLTEAGRMKNALDKMNGDGSGDKPTKVQGQLNNLKFLKAAGMSDKAINAAANYRIAEYNKQIENLQKQIDGARETQKKNIGGIAGTKGFNDSLNDLIAKRDALREMLIKYREGVKEITKPVEVKIETDNAEQNVESLKVKLIELEAQRKKAIAAGDTDLSKNLAKQISQVKSDIKGLVGTTTTTETGKTEVEAAIGSIDYQTAKVQELQKAWRAAADDDSRQKIKKEIEEQQYILDRMTGKETFDPSKLNIFPNIDAQKAKVEELRQAWESVANDDSRQKIKRELEEAQATLDRMTANVKSLKGVSIAAEIKVDLEDPLKRAQETLKTTRLEIEAEIKADATKVDTATLHTLLKDAIQSGIDDGLMNMTFASIGDQIAQGIDVPEEAWQKILDQYNALREQIGMVPIGLDFKTGSIDTSTKEKGGSSLESSQKLVSGLSSVSSGLQQMGVKIPDGVQNVMGGIQGLMTVIQGVQSIISIFNTSTATAQTLTTNTNTAAMTALTSAVIANTAAITTNTITPSFFAGGGVVHAASGYVGGSHFSGDLVPALLNSGELVLNQAQQGNIASQLQAASMFNGGGGGGHDYVSGQNIYLGTNNYLKGSGQGQLVTTRMLRQYGLIN